MSVLSTPASSCVFTFADDDDDDEFGDDCGQYVKATLPKVMRTTTAAANMYQTIFFDRIGS